MKSFVYVYKMDTMDTVEKKVTLTETHIRILAKAFKSDNAKRLLVDDELLPQDMRWMLHYPHLNSPTTTNFVMNLYVYAHAIFDILEEQGIEHADEGLLETWKEKIDNRIKDLWAAEESINKGGSLSNEGRHKEAIAYYESAIHYTFSLFGRLIILTGVHQHSHKMKKLCLTNELRYQTEYLLWYYLRLLEVRTTSGITKYLADDKPHCITTYSGETKR